MRPIYTFSERHDYHGVVRFIYTSVTLQYRDISWQPNWTCCRIRLVVKTKGKYVVEMQWCVCIRRWNGVTTPMWVIKNQFVFCWKHLPVAVEMIIKCHDVCPKLVKHLRPCHVFTRHLNVFYDWRSIGLQLGLIRFSESGTVLPVFFTVQIILLTFWVLPWGKYFTFYTKCWR